MGGIGDCCTSTCGDLLSLAPPTTLFRGLERIASQWDLVNLSAGSFPVPCCAFVKWNDADYLLKQINNYGTFCAEFTPQQWCTTAYLDEMTLHYTQFSCAPDSFFVRMYAKIFVIMGHVSGGPGGGSGPPYAHGTCGPNPNWCGACGGGFIYLTRDKLVSTLEGEITFTADDHYNDACFEDACGGGPSDEVSTTAYGYCDSFFDPNPGPHNPTYIDFVDVAFTFNFASPFMRNFGADSNDFMRDWFI